MTISPWPDYVRNGGILKVFPEKGFDKSIWWPEFGAAIEFVNKCMEGHKIGLKFVVQDSKGGARVTIQTIPGNDLHAFNELIIGERRGKLDWAHIKVYDNPTLDKTAKGTPISSSVRLHLLVHELIHGIGLDNDEHSTGGVFTKVAPVDKQNVLPPPKISDETIADIRVAWPIAAATK